MDYSHSMKPFFIEIQNFWAWADKFWGIWGFIGQNYQHLFWFSESLVFHFMQSLFLQKTKPLHPHPKYIFEIEI